MLWWPQPGHLISWPQPGHLIDTSQRSIMDRRHHQLESHQHQGSESSIGVIEHQHQVPNSLILALNNHGSHVSLNNWSHITLKVYIVDRAQTSTSRIFNINPTFWINVATSTSMIFIIKSYIFGSLTSMLQQQHQFITRNSSSTQAAATQQQQQLNAEATQRRQQQLSPAARTTATATPNPKSSKHRRTSTFLQALIIRLVISYRGSHRIWDRSSDLAYILFWNSSYQEPQQFRSFYGSPSVLLLSGRRRGRLSFRGRGGEWITM